MREEEIAKLVEGTADPAFVVDGHGRMVAWNCSAHDLFGLPAEQAIGRFCASIHAWQAIRRAEHAGLI